MKHILYFTRKIHSHTGKKLYFNIIGMVLISLFEGVGIILLLPLINITSLLNMESQLPNQLVWIIEYFNQFPKSISLILILGLYLLILLGQSFFQREQTILNVKIQQSYIRCLREETYKALLESNWSFFLNKRKSDLINLMTTEITRVSAGTNMFLQFLTSMVFTIVQIVITFWLSAKITLLVLFFGTIIKILSKNAIKRSTVLGKETFELTQSFLAGITDQFNGIKDIKSNMLEKSHLSWFRNISSRMEQNIIKLAKLNTISQFIYKIFSGLLISLLIYFSIRLFQAQPTQLIIIVMIFSRLWPRISGIQSNLEQLGSMAPSFKALLDLKDLCIRVKELDEKELDNVQPITINNGLECKNISFRYNPALNVYALKNINLKIPANQMTAIVGRSGAGKSTLIDLVMGLNIPEKGEVLIDGNKLSRNNLLSLRQSISYVPQDPFLFNASIRSNLLIINENATEKQLWEALEFAAAAPFVRKLPNGLDTIIGDRGIKLSGGERQRLVLARAILRKPSILVLDEATSSLDTENESKIKEALEKLKGSMTILVIAHRLSTIQNADQVIVLDQGEIIQQGEFGQLAKEKRGVFSRLLKTQMDVSV